MTAPYKYRFNPYPKYFSSEDWVISSLDFLGGNGKIGKFKYAPIIGIDILSGILIKATGKSVLKFAQELLFSPLEISADKNIYFQSKEEQLDFYKSKGANGWVADPNGTNTAGWGLSLTTKDMAKLGQLYLNEGYWNGRQMISDKWIAESTLVQSVWKARHLKYGYLWWIIDEAEHSYAALGDGGNVIYVNPKDRIVVAVSSLFPRAMSQVGMLACTFDECREGQIPRCSEAGYLIVPGVKDRIDFIKREVEPLFK
ncbi:6-aminohexanoate-dimer hydrolase [Acetatifactor muris]|uniref:6-aminohexanoate-dimer hydrolase n=1 Tax=Acetatifactor muris TaxID=879566 RepID=A0A2K4ZNB5_9FIRM|nr:serine hydrolase [Acetatifactor muris]SOY31969.1 6-aminohexanoate-dimer hydrolase [Acetatifactor muris]